ncbi:Uncharacterized protein HZ326_20280 [Fusarium oxysporum f. sp. albedinis]|nr:Uncharacterized protein HZ326_20280 [Fusarium oxysporum f. sp. albedinis]
MSSSRVPIADDFGNTCVGGMEMAVVVTELLEGAVRGNLDVEWKRTIEDTLDYIGGSENMATFLSMMYKKFPKKKDTSVASTIGRRLLSGNCSREEETICLYGNGMFIWS